MKASEVYMMAAELLDTNLRMSGACHAFTEMCREQREFSKICRCKEWSEPLKTLFSDYPGSYWLGPPTEEFRAYRVLALLLMAEIAKDDERIRARQG